MATWQQGISSGGFLAGIGTQNDNAPKASDANTALAYIRDNNDLQRSGQNNIGLQALQGIAGTMQGLKKYDQQQEEAAFQKDYAGAMQSGDRQQVRSLMTKYPGYMDKIQSGMKWADDDQRSTVGNLAAGARLAATSPESMEAWMKNNTADLQRVGLDPSSVAQTYQQNPQGFGEFADHLGMAALGPDKYFDVQDKMVGRRLEGEKNQLTARGQDITARGQDMAASTARRGQDMSYQSAMTGHNLAAQRLALDQQEFGLKVQQAQQKAQELIDGAPKLSVNMEKSIEKSVNDSAASTNSADSMAALAQQFRQEKPTTGLFGNASNMFAKVTGTDTALRDLRIRQNALVNNQVLRFLPPGPATDRDVEIVRQGAPTDMDNPEVVARWLDAMSNLERRSAQFNDFKAEWMSANGNPGQSRNGGQILGMDIQKGESLGSAVKRYMAQNPIEQQASAKNTQPGQPAQSQAQQPNYNSLWGG
ncbi:TPA: phage DNA ejection protein [Citrobacter freundii]|nr:phage DNA ejection protein [Citrobacter freundii]